MSLSSPDNILNLPSPPFCVSKLNFIALSNRKLLKYDKALNYHNVKYFVRLFQ